MANRDQAFTTTEHTRQARGTTSRNLLLRKAIIAGFKILAVIPTSTDNEVNVVYNPTLHKGRPEGELHPIPRVPIPFHTVNIDHLGPFVTSSNREKGSAFTSKDFKKFCDDHQIAHVKNSTATPRANGQAERQNQTLLSALTTMYNKPNAKDWSRHLKNIQFALNELPNATTKKTPNKLLFSYNPRNALKNQLILALHEPSYDPDEVELNRIIALNNITIQQENDGIHRKPTMYDVGDFVLIKKDHPATGDSRKLLPKHQGPFVVEKCLPNDRYVLDSIPGADIKAKTKLVYSSDRMKKWCSPMDESSDEEDDPDDGAEDDTRGSEAEC
ncbi:UNVERIFIED_CONTAM: hypothetical protein PYX00_007582 [Menopon gallinae]|uniref:Integrase catalytic domain-containing protein n=1 Tax=Menopon gallinae TaxID=328185 RepID=A0AAW2HJQ3_9NEOP